MNRPQEYDSDSDDEPEETTINCGAWTVEKLKVELRRRGLRVSGTKAELCSRLQEYAREGRGWVPEVPPDWAGFRNVPIRKLVPTQPIITAPRLTPVPRIASPPRVPTAPVVTAIPTLPRVITPPRVQAVPRVITPPRAPRVTTPPLAPLVVTPPKVTPAPRAVTPPRTTAQPARIPAPPRVISPPRVATLEEEKKSCPPGTIDDITGNEIPADRLVSVKEGDTIFCFDIDTLAKSVVANPKKGPLNPYTRQPLPEAVVTRVNTYIEKTIPIDQLLTEAVIGGDVTRARDMLGRGANPNIFIPDGSSLLNKAVKSQNRAMVRLLLDHQADPNIRSKPLGFTPLIGAVTNGDSEITKMLIDSGANVNDRDDEGRSVLGYAINVYLAGFTPDITRQRMLPGIEYLLAKGAKGLTDRTRARVTDASPELKRLLQNAGLIGPAGGPTQAISEPIRAASPPPAPIRAASPPRIPAPAPTPTLTPAQPPSIRYVPGRAVIPGRFDCSAYTVDKLKDELRKRGARLGGAKADLCARLEAILQDEART